MFRPLLLLPSTGFWKSAKSLVMAQMTLLVVAALVAQKPVSGFCPHGCSCDDRLMMVRCSREAHLDVIPITLNPGIKELHLSDNKIKTVDASFQFYGQLELVDFSGNQMIEVPDKCFLKQQKLTHLSMANNMIMNVTNSTFTGLKSLESMSLRGNQLSGLQPKTFESLPKLEKLDLGNNQITSLPKDVFKNLTNLIVLYLDGNLLTTVPSARVFKPLGNLQDFYLGGNAIQALTKDAFLPLKHLKLLNMSGASIFNISEHAFRGLGGFYTRKDSGLKTLSLAMNALDVIPSEAIRSVSYLEHLYLGGNFIEHVSRSAFGGLSSLRTMDLSESPNLIAIEPQAFSSLPSLSRINLSGCTQLSLSSGSLALSGTTERQVDLVLASLGWTQVSPDLTDWLQVASVDLSHNQLDCTCRLIWLHDVVAAMSAAAAASQNTTDYDAEVQPSVAFCSTPPDLKGHNLETVPRSELKCSSLLLNRSPEDQVVLVIVCVAAALTTGLVVFFGVHCGRQVKKCRSKCQRRSSVCPHSGCCGHGCCCDDVVGESSPNFQGDSCSPSTEEVCCSCVMPSVIQGQPKACHAQHIDYRDFEFLHADFNTVNTKSSYLDDGEDYFLSMSTDRKVLKPIPVSEL